LLGAFGVVLITAAVSLASVAPAQAWEQREVFKSGWAYTDSRLPRQSFVNPAGDAPIGARTGSDGKTHKSRAYFTFDIIRFAGTVVHGATLVIQERSAARCAEAQQVELWRTDPVTATTSWASPPRQRELLGTALAGGESACPGWLTWDIKPVLQKLANRNESVLTVMIRVPYGQEGELSHGRMLVPGPSIHVESNHAPAVTKIGLEHPEWACGTQRNPQPVGARSYGLQMQGTDPDQFDHVGGEFAAWPIDHPEQRSERQGANYGSGFSRVAWEMGQYPHGTVVAWNARAFDGYDYSKWTKPCYVKVDAEPPANPLVTSAKYPNDGQPHGGQGVPGTFTFKANGSADVVGYYWGRYGEFTNYVPAPAPGADATMEYTPTSFVESLSVRSVDAAGLRSETTTYDFYVRTTAPGADITVGGVGLPSRLRMFTDEEGVTEFGYRVGDGAEVRVPAGTDGKAEAQIVFTEVGHTKVVVRSYAGGELIGGATLDVLVEDSPLVESIDFAWPDHDGVVDREGSFTLRPRRPGVVAYEYAFQYDEPQRLDAGPDGTAVLRWTPTRPDWYTLRARSIGADGIRSEWTHYQFSVIDNKPAVHSTTYYDFGAWGGVGIPGEFEFATAMPDVDVFVYRFNGGPEQTVAPDYPWTARVTLTPEHSGRNTLTVRTRFLDGSFSPPREYVFEVSDAPVVVSTDYPEGDSAGQPGQSGRFTFNPGREGIVEYRYTLEGGDQQTVPAGADGRATAEITPSHSGYTTLVVVGATADGTLTAERSYSFRVRDPHVWVSSNFDQYTPRGGIGTKGRFGFGTELSEVTTYEYKLNDGPWQSVPRATDALETHVTLTMERNGENVLSVRGRTTTGQYTPQTDEPFLVGTASLVASETYPSSEWSGGVGVPGTFTFTQGTAGVVEFEYRVDDGEPVLVPAMDGVAIATYTPAISSWLTMTVRGRKADGTWTDPTSYSFGVR
jgi:hypothetical protein